MAGRKLASVQYVHEVAPIEGADRIELVRVLGWQCVAKKGEFKVGDLAVYFEIDSFCPLPRNSSSCVRALIRIPICWGKASG